MEVVGILSVETCIIQVDVEALLLLHLAHGMLRDARVEMLLILGENWKSEHPSPKQTLSSVQLARTHGIVAAPTTAAPD